MGLLRDAGHLIRFGLLFVAAFAVFLVLRHFVVPKTFGEYGHYRGAALGEIAARPVRFAGHETCETCHSDVLQVKAAGKHVNVNCEACHGPLAAHANDPSIAPARLDAATLCVRCHAASAARPRDFPQINADQHFAGVACDTCHKPHTPALEAGGAK